MSRLAEAFWNFFWEMQSGREPVLLGAESMTAAINFGTGQRFWGFAVQQEMHFGDFPLDLPDIFTKQCCSRTAMQFLGKP